MASFQQISVALVCVVAAFAFGNYVNNHSPTDSNQAALKAQPDAAIQPGNVQSRLTVAGFDIVEKRPAPIATMRQPIQSRFGLPSSSAPSNAVNERGIENPLSRILPPPSQLGNSARPEIQRAISAQAIKQNDVPDFSSIIAEFENSPIALPANKQLLGSMPNHSDPIRNLKAIAKTDQQLGPPALVVDRPDFAIDAKQGSQLSSNWDLGNRKAFSEDDFAPRLKDRFNGANSGLQSGEQRINNTPSNSIAANGRPGLAKSFGFSYAEPPAPVDDATEARHKASIISSATDGELEDSSQRWDRQPARSVNAPLARINDASQNPFEPTVADKIRSNHVVSRQPLPERVANLGSTVQNNVVDFEPPRDQQTGLARIPNSRPNSPYTGASVLQPDDSIATNKVRAMLPFGLNDQGKSQLVAIKTRTNSKLESSSTRFVNHVIQPGETLQSISKRYFGKPDFYLDIYLANRTKLNNPVDTPDGTAIRVPVY